MTAISAAVAAVRSRMQGTMTDQLSILSEGYEPNDGVINLTYGVPNIPPGQLACIGLNTFHVITANTDGTVLTVLPSADGGPNEAKTVGETVRLRPRVTDYAIFRELSHEILALSSTATGIFAIRSWVTETSIPWQTYPVDTAVDAAGVTRVLSVRYRRHGSTDRWIDVPNGAWVLQPSADTGPVVRVNWEIPAGTDVQITVSGDFREPTGLDDTTEAIGLLDSQVEIVELGAAASLVLSHETRIQQPQSQGDPRRAQELQAGASAQVAREWRRLQKERTQQEAARLRALYPYVMPTSGGVVI